MSQLFFVFKKNLGFFSERFRKDPRLTQPPIQWVPGAFAPGIAASGA